MRRGARLGGTAIAAAAAAALVSACGSGAPHLDCGGAAAPRTPPTALGYTFLARMHDESQIGHFALLSGAGPDHARYSVDHGRGCVSFSGKRPVVRLGFRTRDSALALALSNERQSEGLGRAPYATRP